MQPTTQKQPTSSKSNPLDDSFTRTSPCKSCPRINKDKSVCIESCERLMAYTVNQPYEHLSCVEIPETYTEKYDECLIEGCNLEGTVRGLCHDCFIRWHHGHLLHPVEGKWIKTKKRGKYRKRRKRCTH